MSVPENFEMVMNRIAAAAKRAERTPSSVRLVTVTKTVGHDLIRQAVSAGAAILGENRVQEAKEKIAVLGNIAHWHLIGHLQTNKAKYAVRLFDLIHSVDNLVLAKELDRQAAKTGKVQDILIEVNIAGEESKAGMAVKGAPALVREIAQLKHLQVRGLMTMPPYSENAEDSRPYFRSLRKLAEAIAQENIPGVSLHEMSMGMSGDFEVAIEEGATLVRVGAAIFGNRVE
jgi:pyridoxal phosphate enzyme (YggS family)